MKIVSRLAWLAIFLLLLASLLGLLSCQGKKIFNSIDVTGADWGKKLSLPNIEGKLVNINDFEGKVTAVFFGFLSCPDICPNSLGKMVKIKKALGKEAENFQVIFVTVDSKRDSPRKVKDYLLSFDKDFIGLIAKNDKLNNLKQEFKLVVQKKEAKDFYTVDHTTHIYLFDKNSTLRLVSTESISFEELFSDIQNLLLL